MADSTLSGGFGRGRVVELERAARGAGLRDADLAAFRAYWESKREGRDVPRRAEIDPRGIAPLLAEAFVAERIAPGLARMRIAGARLGDLMGMEVRGMPLSALIVPADRDRLADLLVDLFDRPAGLTLTLAAEGGIGRPPLAARMVILPLRSDLGDVSRALGCLVTDGDPGRTPRRFGIESVRIDPIDAAAGAPAPVPCSVTGVTGDRVRPVRAARLRAERPYLRLVSSDEG